MYLVDTHVHTAESSSCGELPASDMAALYADAGLDAIVIADHYCPSFFREQAALSWSAQVDRYLRGYRAAHEAGSARGLAVFLGVELRLDGSENDYLILGLSEDFLCAHPRLHETTLAEVRRMVDAADGLLVQAHPFRPRQTRASPEMLHGVEVVNGHPNHASDNPQALRWARENGLLLTAGSDAHFAGGAARAHMGFDRPLIDGADLARAILGGETVEIVGPQGRLALDAARV
jgi:hypothetical protein